jgi:flagellar biosynthetic protein FliP
LIGLALFLTLFTMTPVIDQINEEAWKPYTDEQITQEEFFSRAQVPLKQFMVRNTETSALRLFCNMAGEEIPDSVETGANLPCAW